MSVIVWPRRAHPWQVGTSTTGSDTTLAAASGAEGPAIDAGVAALPGDACAGCRTMSWRRQISRKSPSQWYSFPGTPMHPSTSAKTLTVYQCPRYKKSPTPSPIATASTSAHHGSIKTTISLDGGDETHDSEVRAQNHPSTTKSYF